jgi:hypothetical protein
MGQNWDEWGKDFWEIHLAWFIGRALIPLTIILIIIYVVLATKPQ